MDTAKYSDILKEFSLNPEKYIEKCEDNYEEFLKKCTEKMLADDVKRVFICGQSGSGKTTTSIRLAKKFENAGKKCHIIELDDFFLPRGAQKLNKKGEEDFETIFALDLNAIYEFAKNISENKPVIMPDFDFKKGKKGKTKEIMIDNNDILIIEGIHSFNHRIINAFQPDNKILKIFVTVNSCVEFENTKLSKTDLRFVRRLIRDYHHRNANPDWTIELWRGVRAGEKRYAGGYLKKADLIFNTFINYELFLFKDELLKLAQLGIETAESGNYYKVMRNKYKLVADKKGIDVPEDSILNEFIK